MEAPAEFFSFSFCSVLSSLCQTAAHTQPCDAFLLKKSAGCYPVFKKVTFSTDITEEGACAVGGDEAQSAIVKTEQKYQTGYNDQPVMLVRQSNSNVT